MSTGGIDIIIDFPEGSRLPSGKITLPACQLSFVLGLCTLGLSLEA